MALRDPADKGLPETERRLSEDRSCAGCGTSLQGRRPQAKFCSDRCRMQSARSSRLRAWIHIRADLDRLFGVSEVSKRLGRRPSATAAGVNQRSRPADEELE
jgi:hypothetical protein